MIYIKKITNIIHNNIKTIALILLLIWLISQIIYIIFYWGEPQYSDAKTYQNLAFQCYNNHIWYPSINHINIDSYIFNPGYVNWLLLQLRIFKTLNIIPITNILLNCILLYSIFNITKKLTNQTTAYYTIVLFCLMYSNITISAATMSDLPFACLIYLSLMLSIKNSKYIILAGILMALANYVRPLIILFIIPLIIYMIVNHYKFKHYCIYFCSMVITLLIIASFNYKLNGNFIISSSTGGVNLIMGANDDMTGTYCDTVFEKGKIGYINPLDNLNVFEKDQFWKSQALSWIKENIGKYIIYAPAKLIRLWGGDDYQDLALKDSNIHNKPNLMIRLTKLVYKSFIYYLALTLFILYLLKFKNQLWSNKGLYLIPIILVSGMHMLLYGGMRYHYPFIPIIIMYASMYLFEINHNKSKSLVK